MRIRKFNEQVNDFIFNKDNLDRLSYNEIKDLRYDLIIKSKNDYKQKCEELEVYNKIRFKEKEFDQYNEWIRKSKITKIVKKEDGFYQDFYHDELKDDYFTETEMKTYKLLVEVIEMFGGQEKYYQKMLKNDIDKIGDSKYNLF